MSQTELLWHLNGNLGYYLRSIWMLLDPVERRLRLERTLGTLDGLIDYIDDMPLGVSGNWVVFGYDGPLSGWEEHYNDDPENPNEDLVALPTRGLFAEAQFGHCNSCETRDITRMWDWTQMTTETPPPIEGVQPGPKGQPEPVPQPTTFPSPVVQITQPPAAPDPVGLAAAMKVIGTPNIFRDMSGLSQVEQLLNGLASSLRAAGPRPICFRKHSLQRRFLGRLWGRPSIVSIECMALCARVRTAAKDWIPYQP